jgi:hypothetical protein
VYILRAHRWVIWWACIGLICGAIAIVNMLGHHLSRVQDRILIILGAAHWVLGGIVCWIFEGVEIKRRNPSPPRENTTDPASTTEWHPPSDFLLPGRR